MVPTIVDGIKRDGIFFSLINTFEISAIVWGAIFIGIHYALQGAATRIPLAERFALVGIAIACFIPLGPGRWVILSALSILMIWREPALDPLSRASWIFLAVSVPMFWSKRLFNVFAEFFLSLDAMFVSSITQTARVSNLVAMPKGSGFLEIAPRCSSMANVSLAILCWVIFTQTAKLRWQPRNLLWCAAACGSVVMINVTRISLIGFFPDKYELLHGAVGSTVASWLTVAAVMTICYYGVGRGRISSL